MTEIQIDAGTLEFSDAGMTATGLLVPFGEECRSNLGAFTVDSGVFTIPTDLTGASLNIEHRRESVVGGFTSATEKTDGIFGTFAFAETDEGREAYREAKEGKRKHLSAEVANVIIQGGKAIGGKLFAAALVERPAFPSATLLAAAPDTIPVEPTPTTLLEPVAGVVAIEVTQIPESVDVTYSDGTNVPNITKFTPESETLVAAAAVPNTLAAPPAPIKPITLAEIGQLLYAAAQGQLSQEEFKDRLGRQNGETLFGALSDVKYDGAGGIAGSMGILPQWIGEVWRALNYRQQVLPLFSHKDLTSLTLNGFKWTTKPAGGDWAGNKGNVPSNTLVVAPVTGTASRYAIGHDIAREFVDFEVPGFFESYAGAVTEDYAKWADAKVATEVTAGATALAADALTTLPGVTGGTIGSAASAIIDGATVLVTNGVLPSFALVAPALWKQMAKMPKSNVLGYLNAALGLSEGDLDGFVIRPSASVATGKVLVGAREAVTVYELPGAPIRIDALDLARGGVDKAAFGYAGVVINDATGLQLVTAALV